MSLQVWLPFIDSPAKNLGAYYTNITNNNVALTTGGKIANNCADFSTGDYIKLNNTSQLFNNNTKAISLAFWFKTTVNDNMCFFCDRTATGNGLALFKLKTEFRFDTANSSYHTTFNCDGTYPEWTHFCFTWDGIVKRMYVDGTLIASKNSQVALEQVGNNIMIGASVSNTNADITSIANQLLGQLADYRIYDHALSALEVKELSKALVIHYTFDDELLSSYPNLLQNETGLIQPSGVNNISISSTNNRIGKYSGQFNGMNSYIDTPMIKSDMFTSDYTLSFWVYPLDNGRAVYFGDYNTTGGNFINIERYAEGNFRYWYNGGQNGKDKAVAGLNAEINKWTMLTVSHSTGVLKFYKNGSYIESYTLLEPIAKTSGVMRIGRDGRDATNATASSSTPFNGYMDDFRFYVTQLSDNDIKDLYNSGASLSDLGDAHANNFIENATYHGVDEYHNIQANEIYEDILGKEYQQLEYLESTGTQYIDTGFQPNNNTHIQITYKSNTAELKALFGARATSNQKVFTAWVEDGAIYTHYGNRDYNAISPISGNTYQKFIYNQNKNIGKVVFNNGVEGTANSAEALFNPECNLTLLAVNTKNTIDTRRSVGCLYACQIYDNGTLIRDYYPARRMSDGTLGLYDVVNNEFYRNAGSGSFKAGPTVSVNETSAFTENKNFTSRQIIEI